MVKLVAAMITAGLLLANVQSLADDIPKDHFNNSQMMKHCMTHMAAKNDGSTKSQMKAACKTQMIGGMSNENTTKGETLVHGDMKPAPAVHP